MTRECHVRFCERLGVGLPGATLPPGTRALHICAVCHMHRPSVQSLIKGAQPEIRQLAVVFVLKRLKLPKCMLGAKHRI